MPVAVVSGVLLLAVACLSAFAPGYWTGLGFPLDDSWIHAVYGRELARSAMLAYNPGIPAAGETSPLWAVVFALPHLVAGDPGTVALLMKILGFGLHAVTVVLALQLARRLDAHMAIALTAAGAIALHPDLLAASVSGMELPLGTALTIWTALEILRGPSWRLALACFLMPLGRPELACVAFFLAGVRIVAGGRVARLRLALVVGGASLASFALVALRNVMVTGRPMPSTFYAKVGTRGLPAWFVQWFGFHDLLGQFAVVNSLFLLVPLTLLALWLLWRRRQPAIATTAPRVSSAASDAQARRDALPVDALAAGLLLTGIGFFSVSFALVPPTGHTAFYFQRYAMPGLPLVLLGVPLLIDVVLRLLPPARLNVFRALVIGALAVSVTLPMPARLWRLANDARNIDDVQVAEGQALAQAAPHHVAWVVDAGAVRYFGNATIVDTMGLNTPEMLSSERQAYLDRHRPNYISMVGGWTELDNASIRAMTSQTFQPTTRYTVTAFMPQAVHFLLRCPAQPHSGTYAVFGARTDFTCGTW